MLILQVVPHKHERIWGVELLSKFEMNKPFSTREIQNKKQNPIVCSCIQGMADFTM